MLKLNRDSIEWAIEFTKRHSDGDIFPPIPEIAALSQAPQDYISALSSTPLIQLTPQAYRRFVVPKRELSYRLATQLHPQDSIILTALVHQYGKGIEDRRLTSDIVYSYRFEPQKDHGLYRSPPQWNAFWSKARMASEGCSHVLYCDIADFYNQIYHHVVENQLSESKFPKDAVKWIVDLLKSTTATVSRGIPIGPHAVHLIAECTLVPVDNSLVSHGLYFIRYADDLVIFCESRDDAKRDLFEIVRTLDKQQRLILQDSKTRVFSADDFAQHCKEMIEDRPISEAEDRLLNIVGKYSEGNPYALITYNDISEEDWKQFSREVLDTIIMDYLDRDPVDFVRLRWFFRRLAQVGHPGALRSVITNFKSLEPCIAEISSYIGSIQSIDPREWTAVGKELLMLLSCSPIVDNEFFRLSILSLFSRNSYINHFESLASTFGSRDQHARREILLAAKANCAQDWLREHKEDYTSMDPWQQMAFVYCASILPHDERVHFLGKRSFSCSFCECLAKWATKLQRAR